MSGRPDPAHDEWTDDAAGRGPRLEGVPDEASGGGPTPGPDDAVGQDAAGGGDGAATFDGGDAGEEAILTDVAALAAQRDEYLDALQRLKADFDNYRKRVARLQEEQTARAAADLVAKLLPVLDNLDLACAHLGAEDAESEEARALGAARRQLLDVLAKEGLERVDEVGVPFDPTVHDAVAQAPAADDGDEPADGGAGGAHAVDEVMRAGYRWRGQVLRPAMVRVRG